MTYLDRSKQLSLDNTARPAAGVVLCALADIGDPGGRRFRYRVDDNVFMGLIVRFNGHLRGYVDSCPHFGWPLAYEDDHLFSGEHLLCTGHGALFRPLDGMCVAGPCLNEAMIEWPVTVVDGMVVCA